MFLKPVLCLLALSCQYTTHAQPLGNDDKTITKIYQSLNPGISYDEKLQLISAYFLGKPYARGALGEGSKGHYDSRPLYRTDTFDCATYVSTVLALHYANNIKEFRTIINNVRYQDGRPNFLTRNHFMSTDWNLANARKGFITDITLSFTDKHGKSIALVATAKIQKRAWFRKFTPERLHLAKGTTTKDALAALKKDSEHVNNLTAKIPYLPLKTLFDHQGNPNKHVFDQIPHGSIIEIVRPNWRLQKKIGTNLNVSHLGFAIRKDGQLLFREASQLQKKVIDIPLDIYLSDYIDSPTIKGINVQKVNPPK